MSRGSVLFMPLSVVSCPAIGAHIALLDVPRWKRFICRLWLGLLGRFGPRIDRSLLAHLFSPGDPSRVSVSVGSGGYATSGGGEGAGAIQCPGIERCEPREPM